VRSANKKYLRKFGRLAGFQSFYFKWSKFALKRCNQHLRGNKMQILSGIILGGSFEARQENQPKSCSTTDKD